jgi:hypothetical protein
LAIYGIQDKISELEKPFPFLKSDDSMPDFSKKEKLFISPEGDQPRSRMFAFN